MKILIIEDELPSARLLRRKVEKLGYTALDMLQTVEESVQWLLRNPAPDLMLMDIQLADGISFDIFEHVKPQSAIIFTTAYDEYLLRAFKQNSIDYLLKPINDDELKEAIDKFLTYQKPNHRLDKTLINSLLQTPSYKERFTIRVGQLLKIVETSQIECIYSENKGTYLYTQTHENYFLDQSLDALEACLSPKQFFRISRSAIIRLSAIKTINIHTNTRLKIYLHHYVSDDLIVSREKVNDFKHWLDQ